MPPYFIPPSISSVFTNGHSCPALEFVGSVPQWNHPNFLVGVTKCKHGCILGLGGGPYFMTTLNIKRTLDGISKASTVDRSMLLFYNTVLDLIS